MELARRELQRQTGITSDPLKQYYWRTAPSLTRDGGPNRAFSTPEEFEEFKKMARNEPFIVHAFIPKQKGGSSFFIVTSADGEVLLGTREWETPQAPAAKLPPPP